MRQAEEQFGRELIISKKTEIVLRTEYSWSPDNLDIDSFLGERMAGIDQIGDQIEPTSHQIGDQVGDQIGDQVGDQVGDQIDDQVGDQTGDRGINFVLQTTSEPGYWNSKELMKRYEVQKDALNV
ncbi:MAG: hypothetical protein PUP91_15885 [Rhizonema sp. PD37]|nr:hypothetical protein [Rhizonema sp. PD37]